MADPEDDTAANENQSGSEDEEDVVDMHWRRTDDLELDSDAQENPLEGVQQGKYLDEDGELTNPMSPGGQTFEESVEMQTQPKIIHKITIPAAKQDTHKKISPLSCSVAVTSGSLSKSLAQSRKAAKTPLATSRTQITSSSSQVINKSQKPIPKRVSTNGLRCTPP